MEEQKETFTYTYSAAQQEEIAAIRKKYAPDVGLAEVDKMAELRKLDAGVTGKASAAALCVGTLSALIMGTGMSLVMTNLGAKLGMTSVLIPGIIIGIAGMAGVLAAYPLYQLVLKRLRAKAAPRILKLTEELTQG